MQAALAGDSRAYHAFLTSLAHILRRFLTRRIAAHDVEDVTQEILLSLHKARHTYDGQRPVLPWVMAIARYRLTDYLRQHYAAMRHMQVDADMLENLPGTVTELSNADESFNELLAGVPERQRAILTLMHRDGATARETGARLGMTESAVKVAAHRTYKQLREKWKQP
jgi:RNA polymerase sigma-70 factor, ECF subfamily